MTLVKCTERIPGICQNARLQWFTDSFDGALGRHRDTGIPRWGFYMDHFLDFVFMCPVFIGWSFLFAGLNRTLPPYCEHCGAQKD